MLKTDTDLEVVLHDRTGYMRVRERLTNTSSRRDIDLYCCASHAKRMR
jgi:hypothetical protein